MIDVAMLEVDAVDPPPDQSFTLGTMKLAPRVVLAPEPAQLVDGLAVVRQERSR